VPERHGAKTHAVLDVLVFVQIPDVASLTAPDEGRRGLRILIVAFGVRVRASGYQLVRGTLERARC
jgi:hypothetical protein